MEPTHNLKKCKGDVQFKKIMATARKIKIGTSQVVPAVKTLPSMQGVDSTPGQVTQIPQASQKKKKKKIQDLGSLTFAIRGDNFKVSSVVIIPKCS